MNTAKELFAKRKATILTSNSTLNGDSFSSRSFNNSVNKTSSSLDRNNAFENQHQTIFSDDFSETNQHQQQQQPKSHSILSSKHKLPASNTCNLVPKISSTKLHNNKEDEFYVGVDRKNANEDDDEVEYDDNDDDDDDYGDKEEDGERKVSYATSHRNNSTFAKDECASLHSPLVQQS